MLFSILLPLSSLYSKLPPLITHIDICNFLEVKPKSTNVLLHLMIHRLSCIRHEFEHIYIYDNIATKCTTQHLRM